MQAAFTAAAEVTKRIFPTTPESASSRRRLPASVATIPVATDVRRWISRQIVATDVRRWIRLTRWLRWLPRALPPRYLGGYLALLSLGLTARAQAFTNSATLSATVSGTNLLINYTLTTTQGWVTLFAADRPDQLATNARPVDLAPVPPAMAGQFTVPLDPAAPAQFYKLLIEQWPSRGKALVFKGGPLDFAAMRQTYGDITNNVQTADGTATNTTPMIFKQPVEVWLENLGTYDTNGVIVGGNGNLLNGKYGNTDVSSINAPGSGFPLVSRLNATANNDFRVIYDGTGSIPARQAVVWSSEVQLYYDVNDYRTRFLADTFIDELGLPPEIAANLKQRQFRPDLNMGSSPRAGTPVLLVYERTNPGGISLFPINNSGNFPIRTRGPGYHNVPLSIAYATEASMCDYLGLVAFWVLGTNTGFPSDAFFGQNTAWQSNILPALNDGLSGWAAYRYSGNPEIYRYADYALRIWDGRPCGGINVPCDQAENICNVMMFDEANTTKDGVFPYSWPSGFGGTDGPTTSDLAALYFAAIFYDLANDAGLGVHKADLLIWKTLSLITDNVNFPMRAFGAKVQEAARALWPDPRPGRAGLSRYEEDVADVLTSRGIPLNGVADFRTNLPVAIGDATTLDTAAASGFGSQHPEIQPSVNVYGATSTSQNGYTFTNAPANYVAYQFYKHSKYGPCDKLALTDGTFSGSGTGWSYNSNGTFYVELTDRELGNLVLFAPSNHIRWMRSRQRCPNEATGFYAEDVRPFGFRVIQATPNGFSFTASALSETATNKTYQLTIVDPSTTTLGAASYAWSFTNHLGTATSATGSTVQYTATKDEPFTLSITRTRASVTDTLTLRERGNDLDRNGGNAFVSNLVP